MDKKTLIAVIIAMLVVMLYTTNVFAFVDIEGITCPETPSGRYQLDHWGRCIMEPKEFAFMYGESWAEEKSWMAGFLLFFIALPLACIIAIPLLPILLSKPVKWIWVIGMVWWISVDPIRWGWLHNMFS